MEEALVSALNSEISMGNRPSVLVIGGGIAGLSSAIAHNEAGFRVSIAEKRQKLGGRVWSDEDGIDNGPHVILGCYKNFRRLLRAFGTEHLFKKQDTLNLTWMFPGGKLLRLEPPRLPAPIHLLVGLLKLDLPIKKRLGLLKGSVALRRQLPPTGTTLQRWFEIQKVNRDTQSLFFEPLCRAVMNVEAGKADARLFLGTLRVAFGSSRREGAIWCPTVPWSEIIHQGAETYIHKNHIEWIHSGVTEIIPAGDGGLEAVSFRHGKKKTGFDRIVLAVPWLEAARLSPFASFAKKAIKIEASPIVSVSFPPPRLPLPFHDLLIALQGGEPFHFICRQPGPKSWLTLLAGAATNPHLRTKNDWVLAGSKCLQSFLGKALPLPDNHKDLAEIRRESKATIAATPETADFRPPPGPTNIKGLWIAGDWTATGFPSTLEGAAKSGFLCPNL